jgi:hypothetical protein
MYDEWVRENIATNKPYDQVARDRLVAEGTTERRGTFFLTM